MLKINAGHFCGAVFMLGKAQIWVEKKSENATGKLGAGDVTATVDRLSELLITARRLGAKVTMNATQALIVTLKTKEGVTYGEVAKEFAYIERTLRYELEATQLFALPLAKHEYWEQSSSLFGSEVQERFPYAIDDVAGAGKCLATEQGTATVFHLMRVMEDGLKGLAKEIGIPYAPSWESYIKQITAKMETPYKKRGPKWRKNGALYREVLGDLQAVKFAWRNPTMHIVKKYTPEEAEDIFRAVRTFMQRLAKGLPPLPTPKLRGGVFD